MPKIQEHCMRVRLPRINRQPELALSTHNHKPLQ
ncbi:hypothetical protein T05_14424 [Trichinella murrelli]|uniref:Uncharacterized protein n=1 Tax=Trichinella murrelli TaxID=144512 RepID=A0A0V0ST56_9BILA|nr:hypothetical protein T05_14424 [Trichinella murrelli]